MILFTNCEFLQMNSYDGDGRKTPKYIQKQRNKGKIPRLVAFPSPRLENWRPTVFRVESTGNKLDLP